MYNKDQYTLNLQPIPQGPSTWHSTLEHSFLQRNDQLGLLGGLVEVDVEILRTADTYELLVHLIGHVQVTCARCLTPAELPVDTSYELVVKLGATYNDEDDMEIIVPRTDARLDLQQILYEWVLLSLPINKGHQPGNCPGEYEKVLEKYRPKTKEEKKDQVDPRWEKLWSLK